MPYIVIDLEWNQAMSAKSSVYNHLPIHLRGEIIQIGAVKLNDDFTPGEEFQCDVRPVWFRKMHHKVKKLTGFDDARLQNGLPFSEAAEKFRDWCGPDCVFMTWGYDDRGIMEQNLILHDLDIDILGQWVNLQLIYNQQTDGDRNQKSLETAMEHFGIEQTRTAHDALGDAYNTALVCSKLDMETGLAGYNNLLTHLSKHTHKNPDREGPDPIAHGVSDSFSTRDALWRNEEEAIITCPVCGNAMERTKWVNQGDRRYMAMSACEEHGPFLLRIRLRMDEDTSLWHANRLIYRADEAMEEKFMERMAHPRRRRSRKTSKR